MKQAVITTSKPSGESKSRAATPHKEGVPNYGHHDRMERNVLLEAPGDRDLGLLKTLKVKNGRNLTPPPTN